MTLISQRPRIEPAYCDLRGPPAKLPRRLVIFYALGGLALGSDRCLIG
jgi:hypothetical protein